MNKHLALSALLMDLEAQLRNLNLWQLQRPSEDALASEQPFCVDTLTFPQWLQFIFVERMQVMIAQQLVLPSACQIAPMGEEYFKTADYAVSDILQCLLAIDQLLSN